MRTVDVIRIATRGPGDVSGLNSLIEQGRIQPAEIIAVMGKTEGNGCVNDYTREYATQALARLIARYLDLEPWALEQRVAFVMSGGTEGVLSPHITVFTRRDQAQPLAGRTLAGKRLAIGVGFTRPFKPEEVGRMAQVHETAGAVRGAMSDAGIDDPRDVHFVQIKCPLLTAAAMNDALARGRTPVTEDTYASMAYSRGASALGVASALAEIDAARLGDDVLMTDWSLYSRVASTSAGVELDRNVVIVMGMSASSSSPFVIEHDVMADAIDFRAITRIMERLQVNDAQAAERIVNVFAKAEASASGLVRGLRHTMLNDSDIHSTRHARAAVGAVVASVVGHTAIYVSGGAEHQGPSGGGPVAVIARC